MNFGRILGSVITETVFAWPGVTPERGCHLYRRLPVIIFP
jgi:hypothetical protein